MARPSRGDRVFTGVRLPRKYREAAEALAAKHGIAVGDAITLVFGQALGLPVPDYCRPQRDISQEELPLNKAS